MKYQVKSVLLKINITGEELIINNKVDLYKNTKEKKGNIIRKKMQ